MTQTELDRQDYLRKILTARVYDVARETPLDEAKRLSLRIGNKVLLKREDTQPVFSFKLRGAFNKMVHLSAEERARGVICASAGNHAQGVALAARRLGCRAVIVMPVTAPALKVEAFEIWAEKWCLWVRVFRMRPLMLSRCRPKRGSPSCIRSMIRT